MATTIAALSDERLEAELKQLATEALTVRGKINADTQKLEAARAERQRIVDGIARGTVKESEGPRIEAAIRQLDILLEGNNGVLATNRAKGEELSKELYRRQTEVAKAAHEKAFAELQQETAALAEKVREQLTQIITGPLAAFDANRAKLVLQFQDLGGIRTAEQFCRMLYNPPGPQENATIDPNVHIRRLIESGWQFFLGLPGGNLALTVCSMRPRD